MNKFVRLPIILILWLSLAVPVLSQNISSAEIDSITEKALHAFNVPGIAVGVIKDGKLIHAKGYGVRSIKSNLPVDEHTLFGIASNTKAFTAAALGILVDENKLKWDDKVTDYIPEFMMSDPWVTREFTIRDLLSHRSGLGLGAGDLMIWPENNFPVEEIIHNIRYLKPVSSFRTKYDYDNLMFIIAGEIVARVSKMSYPEFIEKRIITPLGMVMTAATFSRLTNRSNVIDPHVVVDGTIKAVERTPWEVSAAAGGIYSNITDMAEWIKMQIAGGRYGDGLNKTLFSREVQKAMWSPNTILPIGDSSDYNTHFSTYGLGWRLTDVRGYKRVYHSGGLLGNVTLVTIIPELKLGILVFTNQQSSGALSAVTGSILDSFLGLKGIDRIGQYSRLEQMSRDNADKITTTIWQEINAGISAPKLTDNSSYTGTYADKWFGKMIVTENKGSLFFKSERSPVMSGEMFYYKGNTFVVKWNDRSLEADAFAIFSLDKNGKAIGFRMEAISPLTDFSFDFQDLDFQR